MIQGFRSRTLRPEENIQNINELLNAKTKTKGATKYKLRSEGNSLGGKMKGPESQGMELGSKMKDPGG